MVKEGLTTGVVVVDEAVTMSADSMLIEMTFRCAQIEAAGVHEAREAEAGEVLIERKTLRNSCRSIGATSSTL